MVGELPPTHPQVPLRTFKWESWLFPRDFPIDPGPIQSGPIMNSIPLAALNPLPAGILTRLPFCSSLVGWLCGKLFLPPPPSVLVSPARLDAGPRVHSWWRGGDLRVQAATRALFGSFWAAPMEQWPWVQLPLVSFISGNKRGLQKKGAKDGQSSTFLDVTPSFYLEDSCWKASRHDCSNPFILCRVGPTLREVMASARSQSSLVTEPGLAHCFWSHCSHHSPYSRVSNL